jgi:hypothetical protein
MSLCDLCNVEMGTWRRVSACDFRKAVKNGLRPRGMAAYVNATVMPAVDATSAWVEMAMRDTTDGGLCDECAAEFDKCVGGKDQATTGCALTVGPVPPRPKTALETVATPSVFLIVLGVIYIVLPSISFLIGASFRIMTWVADLKPGQNAPSLPILAGILPILAGIMVFFVCLGSVVLYGGIQMRRLGRYAPAVVGSVAAVLPLSVCCVLGIPVGIWSLTVLRNPFVRAAFGLRGSRRAP